MSMSLRQDSVFSIGSRMASKFDSDDISFDVMSIGELQQTAEDELQQNWTLALENDVYERYLSRLDPQGLKTITRILERAKYTQRVASHLASRSSRMSFRESVINLQDIRPSMFSGPSVLSTPSIASVHSGSRHGTPSLLTTGTLEEASKITIPHRIILANNEVVEMKNQLSNLEESTGKERANLRAEMEEIEVRIREAYETRDYFEENVVDEGIDPITGKIPAEKVIRFIEDWLKTADTIIDRLRLKSTTIGSHIKRAKQQLVQREELGEELHAVDFEQLNIENKDYVRQIEEKNRYLLEMKKITGLYNLNLTQHKQKLNDLLIALNAVKKEIAMKQQQITKLKSDRTNVEIDIEKARKQLTTLLALMENYKVPEILDFVKLQAEFEELQRTHKRLVRRRNIQEIAFKAYKKHATRNRKHTSDDSNWLRMDSKSIS